jgi:hypothetical protein
MRSRLLGLAGVVSAVLFLVFPQKTFAESGDTNIPGGESVITLSREQYKDQLYGFWLGQCIANWTGLVTEMDKIGGKGAGGLPFYTRDDWGTEDLPSIWAGEQNSQLADGKIDFVFEDAGGIWGADDDTDLEYMYQYLLHTHKTAVLTGEQIRDGWIAHIYDEKSEAHPRLKAEGKQLDYKGDFENYLWVSNQTAHQLMINEALVPPETGNPENNPNWFQIDAQLTTEIFGLFAPARPDVALRMAHLPIRTTARENAAWASEFYVMMYSLASYADPEMTLKEKILWMADKARQQLPDGSYSAAMFDFVKSQYKSGATWEEARDRVYVRYQVEQKDGYDITSKNLDCNGCFASGINFAASIVSLLYGEGDIVETIKIGALCGWDSDNPTATWGGLLGFMLGKDGVEEAFGRTFADTFDIHRTRKGFPNDGLDTFDNMARVGVEIVDHVVVAETGGTIDMENNAWRIPDKGPGM